MKTLITILLLTMSVCAADLRLEWQDNSDNEDGFEIWRRVNDGEWQLIGASNNDISTFVDSVIPVGAVLSYRVRAWNQFGESGFTNTVSIGTYPPKPPSDLNRSLFVVPPTNTEVGPTAPRIKTHSGS